MSAIATVRSRDLVRRCGRAGSAGRAHPRGRDCSVLKYVHTSYCVFFSSHTAIFVCLSCLTRRVCWTDLIPARPIVDCTVPYIVALRAMANRDAGPLLSTVIDEQLQQGRALVVQLGDVQRNEFFVWCRAIPGFYTFWQWFCVSLTCVLLVLMARRLYSLWQRPNVVARWYETNVSVFCTSRCVYVCVWRCVTF